MNSPALRINELHLSNIGPFPSLDMNFGDQAGIHLICGENGVGKTTILEAITASWSRGEHHRIKRRQAAEGGSVALKYKTLGSGNELRNDFNEMSPEKGEFTRANLPEAVNLIHVRASRDLKYFVQNAISRDPKFDLQQINQKVAADLSANEIKSWLTNRYLLSPHAEKSSWTPHMTENLATATWLFSVLDEDISLAEVDVTTFDILVSTPNGTIPFELMSSGFRSTYFLLLSIIKEIEFRRLDVSAKQFSGVILVDEIDLHLHPTWQQQIGRILTTAFPMAQIIATTHSPHVVQATHANDVISLRRDRMGNVECKNTLTGKYGFAGWTIEEILEEVMGVENTRTKTFRDAMRKFDFALDAEDSQRGNEALAELEKMLHPNNPLLKLIKIQSAPFAYDDRAEEAKDD